MIQAYQYYQHPPFWKIAVLLVFFSDVQYVFQVESH